LATRGTESDPAHVVADSPRSSLSTVEKTERINRGELDSHQKRVDFLRIEPETLYRTDFAKSNETKPKQKKSSDAGIEESRRRNFRETDGELTGNGRESG